MQSIINSIYKYRNLIIYIALSLLIFNNLYNRNSIYYTQFGKLGLYISAKTSNISYYIKSFLNLKKENSKLLDENLKLLQDKSIFIGYNKADSINSSNVLINANIILNSINKNKNIIVLDKGEVDGVKKEMGVITINGVVGIIKNVTENYSSAISVLNTDLKINAILKNTSTIGSISWDGKNSKIVHLNDIPLSNSLKVGDTVVTGGMSFYFPKGIPIGEIIDYKNQTLNGYYEISVSLFNDFRSLSNLYILRRFDNEEIKKLINE
ncbi:MAG: rod shape-determining protein MreC [Bacteroidota bacterium]